MSLHDNFCPKQKFSSTTSQLVIYIYNADLYSFAAQKIIRTEEDFSPKVTCGTCGPMPTVMVTLLNIGGALCSVPQSLADTHY